MTSYDVWLVHRGRAVLISEAGLGVPALVVQASDGTIGGTVYSKEDLLGAFPLATAEIIGRSHARRRGYSLEYCIPSDGIQTTDVEFVVCREIIDLLPGKPEYVGLFPSGAPRA